MKELFDLSSESLGYSPIETSWGCKGGVLAAAGRKGKMVIFSREGKETHGFTLSTPATGKSKAVVNAIVWNHTGARGVPVSGAALSSSQRGVRARGTPVRNLGHLLQRCQH